MARFGGPGSFAIILNKSTRYPKVRGQKGPLIRQRNFWRAPHRKLCLWPRPDPLAHQRCAPLRCSWDQTMQKLLAAALVVSWFWGGEARAQTGPLYCYGQYALCPASTCIPTGYEITTRVVSTSGVFIGYRRYPEAVCTCPVLQGKFQASGANTVSGDDNLQQLY